MVWVSHLCPWTVVTTTLSMVIGVHNALHGCQKWGEGWRRKEYRKKSVIKWHYITLCGISILVKIAYEFVYYTWGKIGVYCVSYFKYCAFLSFFYFTSLTHLFRMFSISLCVFWSVNFQTNRVFAINNAP